MSNPPLTADHLRNALEYSPDTGLFRWLAAARGRTRGRWFGGAPSASRYLNICVDYSLYRSHRLAWLWMTGEWPKFTIDHIDGDRANNCWRNLRDVPLVQNLWNRRHVGVTGALGVRSAKAPGRYTARITINGKRRDIGTYDSVEDARAARLAAERLVLASALG